MLQRHDGQTTELALTEQGYLIAVEAEEGVSVEAIAEKLAGALTWVEGIGRVDVHYLGPIEQIPEGEESNG